VKKFLVQDLTSDVLNQFKCEVSVKRVLVVYSLCMCLLHDSGCSCIDMWTPFAG